jgi:alkaline phosphatase D
VTLRPKIYTALVVMTLLLPSADVQTQPLDLGDQYKRIHQNALRAVLEGNASASIEALQAYAQAYPNDAETWFMLAVAHTARDELEQAMKSVKRAVELGLPAERFLAGPRSLLQPLTEYQPFQQFVTDRYSEPIHGPMLGRTTAESCSFWIRTAREEPVQVLVSPSADFETPYRSAPTRTRADQDYTAIIDVAGLQPDTTYYYQVIVGDSTGRTLPTPSFRTFPERGTPGAFRVAFGGGAGYVPHHERMWDTIRGCEPRAFLFLGDNVYSDAPTEPEMQQYCYYRRLSRPEFRRFTASTPIYAIWDDHDFGTNDCWGGPDIHEPTWKIPVWRLFRNNWINPYYGGGEAQPGCWFDFSIADIDFFLTDGRYYRTNPKRPNPSMLGPAQKAWLLNKLKNSTATFKVMASGTPWASGTKPGSLDTWDGYPEEREEIFSFINRHKIDGVVLLSADRHRSDVYKIERESGYPFYEFESSRLTNEHSHTTMKDAIFSYNALQSFGLLSFDTTRTDPEVTYTIVNIDGVEIFDITVKRSQLTHSPTR